jgi:hypothetical protein
MIEACRRGPSAAAVTEVLIREEEAGSFAGFKVRGTA